MEAMEEWGHADARVMQRSYTAEVCVSCAWFTYGMDTLPHLCRLCTRWKSSWSKASTSLTVAVTGRPFTKWRSVEPRRMSEQPKLREMWSRVRNHRDEQGDRATLP